MSALVPNRFLFKFEFPLHRCPKPLAVDGDAAKWGTRYLLPPLHAVDGQSGFGKVWGAWDETGLYLACHVEGKRRPLRCDAARFRQSDGLRLMTDMRDTRDIRRATRFCQHWFFLPSGGGARKRQAAAGCARVARATQDAPLASAGDLGIASIVTKTGYSLTAHVAAGALSGFDPEQHPRIGLYYILEDTELGQQPLTVGDDLNWWIDPSTWPTAVLTR